MSQPDARGDTLSILLADSQALFRAGLRRLLEELPYDLSFREAMDGAETIRTLKKSRFDLVILDPVMPDIFPVPLLHSVRRYAKEVPCIVMSGADDREQMMIALDAGARGFIPKDYSPQAMLQAVRLVLSGEEYVPAALARPEDAGRGGAQPRSPRTKLTTQQHTVLQYLANGFSNKEIAAVLGIAEGTVKSHIAALFRRLGAKNRTHAIIIAAQKGLLPPQGQSVKGR